MPARGGEPAGGAAPRSPVSPWDVAANALATALTLGAAAWSLGVPRMLGTAFYPGQFLSALLGTTLAIAYLTLPARRGAERRGPPPYDVAAAAIGLICGWYIAIRYPALVDLILMRPPEAVAVGALIIVLTLEALRRATGWPLVIIVLAFLLYGLFGDLFPGRLAGRAQDWQKLSAYLAFDVNGILGVPLGVAATVVVAFIFFGTLLQATGGSRFFTEAALLSMGRFRGGSVKIAVVASALFGSISGSAVANVVATGVVTIPMIKRGGYPAHKAAAIEASASTGGQLLPPVMGAAAFLMAEFLRVPYAEVALAAVLPGLLYYAALFIQADLEAARIGLAPVDPSEIPDARPVLGGWHFALSFAALIVLLFAYNWQPERAALASSGALVVTALVLGYRGRRPAWAALLGAFARAGFAVLEIILISAAAGIVIGVLNISGLSFNLTYGLVQVGAGEPLVLLVLAAAVCIVLGMGLPTLGVYVILATLVAPALIEVGIQPIAAHLYVLYFGMMSMITPPVAIAAFAAASIADADPMRTGFAAMRFGWSAYIVPFLFVASPSLLLIGEPATVAIAAITAVMGVWLVSIALAGHFVRAIAPGLRLLFAGAGLLALIPAAAFEGALYTDIAGALLGGILIGRELAGGGRPESAGSSARPS
ncbi:MAG TPA: TRAP transporter fused permease subunit [Geminicoccaceae bacterium]|nr:TRAP transporter fused permease subunit [Geminicoccaceae bacterium]